MTDEERKMTGRNLPTEIEIGQSGQNWRIEMGGTTGTWITGGEMKDIGETGIETMTEDRKTETTEETTIMIDTNTKEREEEEVKSLTQVKRGGRNLVRRVNGGKIPQVTPVTSPS